MKKMILAAVTAAAATLYGANLLTERVWKFAKTWNAAGNLNKLADGTYQMENTGNAGTITFHCADDEYTITPGKHYLAVVEMSHSNAQIKSSLFAALPGARYVRKPELRTPYSTGNLAAIEFVARPDERRLSLYLSLSGTGSTIIRKVTVDEITPGNDLIARRGINWNFVAAPETRGNMTRLDDGMLKIEKTEGKAHVMAYLTLPYPIKAGRTYRVTMTGKRSADVQRWGLMSHSGSQRSWPSRPAAGTPGEWESVSLDVTAGSADNGLRIYAVLHSTGILTVKNVVVEELSTRKEILSGRIWTGNPANVGKALKNSDGSWTVAKQSDKGVIVFAHHGFVKVTVGKHYLVEWLVKLAPEQKANSMTYLPNKPKARAPWPSGKALTADGSYQTVTQIVTAMPGEESMRANLVISGKAGNAIVKSCAVTELDDEELQKISAAK